MINVQCKKKQIQLSIANENKQIEIKRKRNCLNQSINHSSNLSHQMYTTKIESHKHNCPSLAHTSTSFYQPPYNPTFQHNNYLSQMNYRLLNEITDSETEKNYYRNKVTEQFHSHHNELENAFMTISEKNQFILQLEQQLDRISKDYRILSDQYVGVKNQLENQKQLNKTELQLTKRNHQAKLQQLQTQSLQRTQLQIAKRIQQVESQCQQRVLMFKSHLQQSKQHSTQLAHQLKLLQQDYHQVMIKNDTIIQESIHRELRKRDFQAQNNYLRDVAQYQHLKKVNQQLKNDITEHLNQIQSITKEMNRLKAENLVLHTKLNDIQEAFQYEKTNNRVTLQQKYKQTEQMQTNTEQPFVPIVLPVETNLVGEIVALKQFLVQKIVTKYQEFFTKASLKEKKKSASLITFKNYLVQEIKNPHQNSLLMHLHTGLERIIKLYCPAMSYSRQFLTVKDEFIRKTLMECEGLNNKQQKLFRLLQLVHRLHHPITHVKSEISTGELKMVEIKIMATLKKIFSSTL